MGKTIKELWAEKKKYDEHPEQPVLQAAEWDSIANAIMTLVTSDAKVASTLTAEDLEAVNWARKRLGA